MIADLIVDLSQPIVASAGASKAGDKRPRISGTQGSVVHGKKVGEVGGRRTVRVETCYLEAQCGAARRGHTITGIDKTPSGIVCR